MPKIRFSVVSFAPPGAALAVLGSTESLGKWDVQRAKKLEARLGQTRLQSEPDFHWAELDVPELGSGQVEYKFVELGGQVKWEDLGAHKNRVLKADSGETDPDSGALLLPVERFAEPGGSESDHTARFYQGVKERQEISVRKVLSQLFVGSCPRHRNHIDYLHSLGITAVFNFQTEEDCRRNCVAGIGMEEDPMAVSKLYEAKGMQYVWMPTFDMSTDGRAQMLPQASFLFAQVLRRGHTIYSHCNAGVGRSVAAACGFLTFALGLSLRQMQYVMASSRPVAFFDFEALHRARPHYDALFGAEGSDGDGDGAAVETKLKEEALALL